MVSIEFLLTSLVVVLIPGTGVIYTISMGLFKGFRASCAAAVGCTLGIIPSMLACILGLAAVIHTSAVAFEFIKYLGVAYLLYLAWGMWRESGAMQLGEESQASSMAIASKGFLINILNPKLTLFFLAFLPQFVPVQASSPLLSMTVLGLVFMLMTLLVFLAYGLLANTLSHTIQNSPRSMTVIQRVFAASFASLAVKLAFSER